MHTCIDIGFLSSRRLQNRIDRLEFYIWPRWIVMNRCLKLTIWSVLRSLLTSSVKSYLVGFGEISWRFLVVGSSSIDSGSELRSFPCVILREGHQKMFLLVLNPPDTINLLSGTSIHTQQHLHPISQLLIPKFPNSPSNFFMVNLLLLTVYSISKIQPLQLKTDNPNTEKMR